MLICVFVYHFVFVGRTSTFSEYDWLYTKPNGGILSKTTTQMEHAQLESRA